MSPEIEIPNTVEKIDVEAFIGSVNLSKVKLPENSKFTNISDYVFSNTALKSITIPSSVVSIGMSVFSKIDELTKIVIPSSVTSIGSNAFGGCTNLADIKVESMNTVYSSDNGVLYNKGSTELIQVPGGKENISIIDTTKVIGDSSFYKCNKLTSVTIPSGVTKIMDADFGSCTNLSEILIQQGNTYYSSSNDGKMIFGYEVVNETPTNELTEIVASVKNTTKIDGINIPSSITKILGGTFSETNLETIDLTDTNIEEINKGAFQSCSSLRTVIGGKKLKIIGISAFLYSPCNIIKLPADIEEIGINGITSSQLQSFEFVDYENEGSIPRKYEYKEGIVYHNSSEGKVIHTVFNFFTELIIPSDIYMIESYAFFGASKIEKVIIEEENNNGLEKIAEKAFFDCYNLKKIQIPSKTKTIGPGAFFGCSKLKEIHIDKVKESITGAPWGAPFGISVVKWK